MAVVTIDEKNLLNIKKFKIGENEFIGGNNILYIEDDHGIKKIKYIIDEASENINKSEHQEFLYHLVSDKGTFFINGTNFFDYNGCIETLLDKDSKKLIQKIFV